MGHRLGRLVTWAALISCVSIYLLLEQLSRLHWSGHCSSAGSGSSESTNCQRHQRNLMMAGEDMAEHHQAAQPLPPDLNGNVSTLGLKAPLQQHLPQLLIIGVRKGGTRALLEMLNLHPAVCMVPVEVHFFDKSDNYQKGLEWYRSQMPLSRADQLTVEKSPSYFVTPEVPERVWAMNPATKLILIVRDPVVRLLSDFAQIEETRLSHGLPTRRFQDVALLSSGEVNTQYRALHISLYAKFLSRWLHVFPRRQLHVVDGDQLVKYPWPEIERVERFLELEPLIRPDQFYFNATKGFYCLREANNSHKCLADTKGRRHPKVPEEVISQLRQFFAPHNRKFFAMVGQQFDWPEQ